MTDKAPKKKKRKSVSVTMKLNKDGTMTMRSSGGFDLRKLAPMAAVVNQENQK